MRDKKPVNTEKQPVDQRGDVLVKKNTKSMGADQHRFTATADQLKACFKAGTVPVEDDFAALIDTAEVGLRATGQAEDQQGRGAGCGMRLSSDGKIEINTACADYADNRHYAPVEVNTTMNKAGLTLSRGFENTPSGLSIKASSGMVVDSSGVHIKQGNGIVADEIGIHVEAGPGIGVDKEGIGVKTGPGMKIDKAGVQVKVGPGLRNDAPGIGLRLGQGMDYEAENEKGYFFFKCGNGLKISAEGRVQLHSGEGIQVTNGGGVDVIPGRGIEVNDQGVCAKLGRGLRFGEDGKTIELATQEVHICYQLAPLKLNTTTNQLVVDLHDGLKPSFMGHLKLNLGRGIILNENGLDMEVGGGLPAGTVYLFPGDKSIPKGWKKRPFSYLTKRQLTMLSELSKYADPDPLCFIEKC